MLKYKKGDLIEAAKSGEVNTIAHQCNCFNNMGAGIAPQIKKAFPEAWLADNATEKGDKGKFGRLSYAVSGNVLIFNLYGQYGWWRQKDGSINTDYGMLRKSLEQMSRMLYSKRDKAKIGLPRIGCGLGGGDWGIVSQIIEEELSDFDVTIYDL